MFVANDSSDVHPEQCTCINQCKLVTYSSVVSASRLSVSDIRIKMSDKLQSTTTGDFWDALEIAQRVVEDAMHQTVQRMLDVLQASDAQLTIIFQLHENSRPSTYLNFVSLILAFYAAPECYR